MPKSVSGALRMGIGPSKSRLQKSLQQSLTLVDAANPKTSDEKQRLIDRLLNLIPPMESQIQTLLEDKQQWIELIGGIDDDTECETEEALFNDTAYSPTGFMTVVLDAKETLSLLQSRLKRLETSSVVTSTAPPPSVPNHATPNAVVPKPTAKLPKLNLPTFIGYYLEWEQFWRMFSINIHDTALSKVEKFAYLQGQLTHTALATIDGMSITDDNYDVAVSALKTRFERPSQQLIGSYYSQLKKIGRSTCKVDDLQRTFDACERLFRLLEKAGESLANNQSLVLDVYSKYPESVVERLFSRRGITATSTLGDVRKALETHIREAESLSEIFEEMKPFCPTKPEKSSSSIKIHEQATRATSALSSATVEKPAAQKSRNNAESDTPKSNCYFCNGPHFNAQCDKYITVESRIQQLVSLNRCTRCLSNTHTADDCRTPSKTISCFFCRSTGSHRSPLCTQKFGSPGKTSTTLVTADITTTDGATNQSKPASTLLNANESSLLLTASTIIRNLETGQFVQARLLFDSGSHRTYITSACVEELGLSSGRTDTMNVAIFGTKRTLSVESSVVTVTVVQRDGSCKDVKANTTPIITGGAILPDRLPDEAAEWLGAMKGELADDYSLNTGRVDVLVGTDYFWDFITGTKITTSFGIHLVPSTLGILLTGTYKDDTSQKAATLLCVTEAQSPILGLPSVDTKLRAGDAPDVDDFWELERIGISESAVENDDAKALTQFSNSIDYTEGRYQVKWPWRPDADKLPTNYQLALGRFRSLAKRLASSPDIRDKYHEVINQQLTNGIIEKVAEVNSTTNPDHPIHYLPHHPVVRPSSNTTKVRVVYDASSKTRKDVKSLNECLYRGPVILPDLCAVLMRLRLNHDAVVADIEKAFLQMSLQFEDRDVTRFLWFEVE